MLHYLSSQASRYKFLSLSLEEELQKHRHTHALLSSLVNELDILYIRWEDRMVNTINFLLIISFPKYLLTYIF